MPHSQKTRYLRTPWDCSSPGEASTFSVQPENGTATYTMGLLIVGLSVQCLPYSQKTVRLLRHGMDCSSSGEAYSICHKDRTLHTYYAMGSIAHRQFKRTMFAIRLENGILRHGIAHRRANVQRLPYSQKTEHLLRHAIDCSSSG